MCEECENRNAAHAEIRELIAQSREHNKDSRDITAAVGAELDQLRERIKDLEAEVARTRLTFR